MGLKGFVWYSEPMKRLKASVTALLPSDDVWELDWDVLIILDACRVDLFSETIESPSTIISPASTSRTWIRRTFDRDVSDVAYITGNAHLDEMPADEFGYFHIQDIKETQRGVTTVPPDPLVDHAVYAWRNREQFDINRMIVHFMQPHAPFRSRPEWFRETERDDGISAFIWQRLKDGEFTREEVWEAYRDNLEWVWDEGVSVLAENLNGHMAVSADHGNALGEYGCYGHPMGCPADAVREVPWYKIKAEDTNSYEPDVGTRSESIDSEEQLRALGYK